jgi:hypothetical protein
MAHDTVATKRVRRNPAREILSQEQRDIVYDFCRPEFEFLG